MSSITRRRFLAGSAKTALASVFLVQGSTAATKLQRAKLKATASEPTTRALERLEQFIARHLRETGVPGLTLAVADRQQPLKIAGYGFADTKALLRVTPSTMFEIGSISKSFVAITLLQLREEGKVDFNKPIVEYLPWLKISSSFEPITPAHILSHTSGLPAAPLLLDALLSELRVSYAPGNRFLYSNTGYNILGFVIETLDKKSFGDAVRSRVLEPLGMNSSAAIIHNQIREKMAVGYRPLREGLPFPTGGALGEAPWLEMDMAAGSIASTPADMSKYLQMLLNRGKGPNSQIISEDSFNLFIKPEVKAPFRGEEASYSYGLWVSEIDGHTRLRHTGGMVAFSSSLDADLTSGVGAFASVNANLRGYRPVAVTRYAVDLLNASLAGKPLPDPPPPPASSLEVSNATDYEGTFNSPDGKRLVFVERNRRLLLMYNGRPIELERSGRDLFIVKHPDFEVFPLGFVRDHDIVTEAFHGANWYAGAHYAGPRTFSYPQQWNAFVGHYTNDSPWYGDTRIVLRKGKLYSDGVQGLIPKGDTSFGVGEPEGPDYLEFLSILDGRAMRLSLSGIDFRRTFTP